jgi:hypothetical protein
MIRAFARPSMIGDSFAISLVTSPSDYSDHRILRLGEPGAGNMWEPYDPDALSDVHPTLRLTAWELTALDDALAEIRHGSDLRALRGDLARESGRVDKCLDALIRIAGGQPINVPLGVAPVHPGSPR